MCHSRAPECMNDWRCRRVAGADGRTARYLRLAGLRKYGRSDGLALRSPDLISSDPASRRQGDDLSMNAPDADEADFPIEPGLPMARLPDIGQWAHHAALLGGGLVSTVLGERPTPEFRAERLTRLGATGISPIFGGPSYWLSARATYRASPQAWLGGMGMDRFLPVIVDFPFYADGFIEFVPPAGYTPQAGDLRRVFFYFSDLPAGGPVLLSVLVFTEAQQGQTGHLSLGYNPLEGGGEEAPLTAPVTIPVPSSPEWLYSPLSVDLLVYAQDLPAQPVFILEVGAGISVARFASATLHRPPPVISQGPT